MVFSLDLARRRAACCAAFLVCLAPLAAGGARDPRGAGAQAALEGARHRVRIEGTVLLSGGAPARGAVVVSSAGGSAAAGEDGAFALELAVPPGTDSVELTAVASGPRGSHLARGRVDGLRDGAVRQAGALLVSLTQGCTPEWLPTFGGTPGTDGVVHALAAFDDGSGAGPALYAGGAFTTAGGQLVNHVARWDGQGWSPLGSGMDQAVYALAVHDDGSGAALHAGGAFLTAGGQDARRIARWDGQEWGAVGGGMDGTVVALCVFDDGSGAGPALYAGGWFTSAGGQAASRVARWDGQVWSPLGSGIAAGSVQALAVLGPALYAGGDFTVVGGAAASRIARWDGKAWSPLGSGVNQAVLALVAFDDGAGAGPALHAGGWFTSAGGLAANHVARWDGRAWSPLPAGTDGPVRALTVLDDASGAGPALYAGGAFDFAGGGLANHVARWDGRGWSPVSGGVNGQVFALAALDDGSHAGPALCAGGAFTTAAGHPARHIATWDGQGWAGLGDGLEGEVRALTAFDDGSGTGPALHAGGDFVFAGGTSASRIAKWDGHGWSALGGGLSSSVEALTVFDDGGGPALYAGGSFVSAGGLLVSRIARWDGQGWSALGSGTNSTVRSLCVFDDGSGAGPALYAGGSFTSAGGGLASRIARWDGQGWTGLGTGVNGTVEALAAFDGGSGAGPALYAAGSFTAAGGQPASRVARWDGGSWSALGSGLDGSVRSLAVFDDGADAGPALYAGGYFTVAGGASAKRIARWDGRAWSPLGSGIDGGGVLALAVFDDGSGPALYGGGDFTSAGGVSASGIARWDGGTWSALASGIQGAVEAQLGFDDGSGAAPALHAGGTFEVSPGGDSFLARWGCPAVEDVPGCSGNPAALASASSAASIGGVFDVSLSASQLTAGLGLLYLGLDGTDAAGCGLLAPGIGELLLALAPPPLPAGSSSLEAGVALFALPVPDEPALVGVHVAFQGVAVGLFDPGVPIELSHALLVTITQ